MTYTEANIRDSVAVKLDEIEPGLVLIGTEVPLPNALGARGFIDILARDAFANFVVIEIKRADQTARQALHEVLKYGELMSREHGLPQHRIRLIIASTTWHELTVPFSAFVCVSPYNLTGVTLTVDASGGLTSAVPVEPLPPIVRSGISQEQLALLWRNAAPRDEAWDTLEPHFETYGLVDMLGIELDYQGENENVTTPFALLLVPGRMSLDEARRLGFIEDDFPMGKDHDEDEFDLHGLEEPEGEALNRLMSDDHLQSDDAESHSSERFARDLQSGWVPTRIRRLGSFSSAAYVSDEELVNLVVGTEGDNRVVLEAHASPQHGQAWAEMSLRTSAFLRWNVSWQDGLSAWLEAYDREDVSGCRLRIYHLFDSIRGLIALSTGGDGRWLDTLNATCEKSSGEMAHLVGMLRWDGAGVDPETAIREVFDDGVEDYLFLGHGPESESRLLTAMGLRHQLWQRAAGETVEWTGEGPGDRADPGDAMSLFKYVSLHQEALQALKFQIEQRSFGFFG